MSNWTNIPEKHKPTLTRAQAKSLPPGEFVLYTNIYTFLKRRVDWSEKYLVLIELYWHGFCPYQPIKPYVTLSRGLSPFFDCLDQTCKINEIFIFLF